MFKPKRCTIPTVYCGNKKKTPKKYVRKGTRVECIRKGFGAGKYSERALSLPKYSLQRIKYVGEKYEKRFKNNQIHNTKDLLKELGPMTSKNKELILKKILRRKDKKLDGKAYNMVILYLYHNGQSNLPKCKKLKI